jgi:hypothetical protein
MKITTVKDVNQLFSSGFVFLMTLGKIWSQNCGILSMTPAAPILKYCDMVHKQGRSTRKNRMHMGHSVQFATVGFIVGMGLGLTASAAVLIGEYKAAFVTKVSVQSAKRMVCKVSVQSAKRMVCKVGVQSAKRMVCKVSVQSAKRVVSKVSVQSAKRMVSKVSVQSAKCKS